MPDAAVLVLTSLPDHDAARNLAQALLARRLAACVNIGTPVESMYHWQGQIETAREVPLAIKTRAVLYTQVEALIARLHPYEIPEIVAVPILHGSAPYLDWIAAETAAR